MEKWKTILGVEEQRADAEPVDNTNMTREVKADRRQRKKATKKLLEEQSADAEPVDNTNMTGDAKADRRQRKKATTKLPGKCTEKKSRQRKYDGWSCAGMARLNQLFSLVNNDKASAQSEQMECELLAFCRAQVGITNKQHHKMVSDLCCVWLLMCF